MNFTIVAVAFLSLSSPQASDGGAAPASPASPELSGTGGQGQQSGGATQTDPQTGERLQCRRVSESGTHRYRRVCMTAAQWRNYEDNQ
jgi:hypothetical protein